MRTPRWVWTAEIRVRWGDLRVGVHLRLDRWRGNSLTLQLPLVQLVVWRRLK